jgi:hypothetical protein
MICDALVIIGCILYAGLSIYDLSEWNALVGAIVLAVLAIASLSGWRSKVSHYAHSVQALEELVLWWRSMASDASFGGEREGDRVKEREREECMQKLVMSGEEIIRREQFAWTSSSSALKLFLRD